MKKFCCYQDYLVKLAKQTSHWVEQSKLIRVLSTGVWVHWQVLLTRFFWYKWQFYVYLPAQHIKRTVVLSSIWQKRGYEEYSGLCIQLGKFLGNFRYCQIHKWFIVNLVFKRNSRATMASSCKILFRMFCFALLLSISFSKLLDAFLIYSLFWKSNQGINVWMGSIHI